MTKIRTHAIWALVSAVLTSAVCSLPTTAGEFFTLKGHGGPVMDIAVSQNNGAIASASFDNSVGVWSGRTPRWLDSHEAAVNTVKFVDDKRIISAGDDYSVRLWNISSGEAAILGRHKGKVLSLAVAPDRLSVASASWDGTIGLWKLDGSGSVFLKGHKAGVNDVAYSADGHLLYSTSTDGTIRTWDVSNQSEKRLMLRHGFGVNVMILNHDHGWLAYGTVDGVTRVIDLSSDKQIADFTLERRPILSIAQTANGDKIGVGDGDGFIMIVDTKNWKIVHDFRAALRGPIWAIAFSRDSENIHAGGIENIVYSWPLDQIKDLGPMADSKPKFLKDPDKMENGERQFTRKCSICHSLEPGNDRKAGPTLHALFGRNAGTLYSYNYSKTLSGSDIVWNEKTIDKLFNLGPDHYIPGSKMPMQRIVAQKDRDDLIGYLKRETAADKE